MYKKRIKALLIILSLVIPMAACSPLYAGYAKNPENKSGKKKIAIFDFTANAVPPEYAKIVRNYIETSLYTTGDFRMLERENIEKILREKNIVIPKSDDTTKVVLAGKSLSADFIVVGSIDKLEQYKITVRVVDIEKGEILSVYDQVYDSGKDVDLITKKIAKGISNDIRKYIKNGYLSSNFYDFYDVILTARFNYLYPFGELAKIVNPGPGGSLEAGINNIILENLSFGFEFGYSSFTGSDNSNDRATFMPVLAGTAYRFDIFRRLYLAASLYGGINIVNMRHGTGEGFNMDDDSSRTFIDSLFKTGLHLCFVPLDSIHFQAGAEYCIDFEKNEAYRFMELGLGVVFVF